MPGQSKWKRRVAGIMHVIVYVGFIIINIELLEIIIDGLFELIEYLLLGSFYDVLIASFEILQF
jgi:cytochrome b561